MLYFCLTNNIKLLLYIQNFERTDVAEITDDAVLVCDKNQVQDVKKTVEDLRNRKEFKFL